MQIEIADLRRTLIENKQHFSQTLDRAKQKQVRLILIGQIGLIETILIWLSNQEKKGVVNMAELKLGELVKWEQKPRKNSVDALIINDAKSLRKNFDAIKVTVENIKWNTFSNRVYQLREDKQIPLNVVPRKGEDGTPYLVYMDELPASRGRRK